MHSALKVCRNIAPGMFYTGSSHAPRVRVRLRVRARVRMKVR